MRRITLAIVLVCLTASTGCNVCWWGKRETELRSPTDIRKSHFWCMGEDALFKYPSGPKREFYGHRPTCWRSWPVDGSQWRDLHCGVPKGTGEFPGESIITPTQVLPSSPEMIPVPFDQSREGSHSFDDTRPIHASLSVPDTAPLYINEIAVETAFVQQSVPQRSLPLEISEPRIEPIQQLATSLPTVDPPTSSNQLPQVVSPPALETEVARVLAPPARVPIIPSAQSSTASSSGVDYSTLGPPELPPLPDLPTESKSGVDYSTLAPPPMH